MEENVCIDFQTIINLSERMLENARKEKWDDVTIIESERKKLLAEFFSKPVRLKNGWLTTGIRSILEKDREIVKLGSRKRDEMRFALQKFSRGKEIVEAYSAVG